MKSTKERIIVKNIMSNIQLYLEKLKTFEIQESKEFISYISHGGDINCVFSKYGMEIINSDDEVDATISYDIGIPVFVCLMEDIKRSGGK